MVHGVERLGEVDEQRIKRLIVFAAFLLDLTGGKYHVDCAAAGTEATLFFWHVGLEDFGGQTVEQDPGDNLTSSGQ